jgi:hypothetical protein
MILLGLLLGLSMPSPAQTVIVIYKQELRLEVWKDGAMEKQWSICKLSTLAGRKTEEGDMLVPEGIYEVDTYNPNSGSYKTLHINYPNAFDRTQGCTGGAIGIHGKCSSVGCIGMSNQQMDEIVKMLKKDLKTLPIPVLIFYSSKVSRVKRLIKLFRQRGDKSSATFLERMEKVRMYWDEHHRVPEYTWDKHGYVVIK